VLPRPQNPEELAEAMRCAAGLGGPIALEGGGSKRNMGGPLAATGTAISTAALDRVFRYEPGDLTIGVGAGMRYCELSRILAANGQMLPLDPPFSSTATIGGILGANTSGPRRRLYGTARDFTIGMKFATLEGKLVESGGMVVKNVAGLDMAKLMIGSFGTLAAIASANFKVVPIPPCSRTFAAGFASASAACAARNRILSSVLQPAAVDLLNPEASKRVGCEGFHLLVQGTGNSAAVARYAGALEGAETIEGEREMELWNKLREFTPEFLAEHPEGAVVRISCVLGDVARAMESLKAPVVARAGSGVLYAYFESLQDAREAAEEAARRGWPAVVEYAPQVAKRDAVLWPAPGSDFAIMQRMKRLFDPNLLLNPKRLYGRI
jgi:glycolate oxidase FAD binding subunit